jgi:hypothetical protein
LRFLYLLENPGSRYVYIYIYITGFEYVEIMSFV